MTQANIVDQYTFNPLAKTITFDEYDSIDLRGIQLITYMEPTSPVIIFQFNGASKGGTVSGNVLTLTFDTTALNASVELQIIYNPPSGGFFDQVFSTLNLMISGIIREFSGVVTNTSLGKKVQAVLSNSDSTLGAVNSVATVTTVSTLTTASSVTNIVNMGNLPAENIVRDLNLIAYNTGARSKII